MRKAAVAFTCCLCAGITTFALIKPSLGRQRSPEVGLVKQTHPEGRLAPRSNPPEGPIEIPNGVEVSYSLPTSEFTLHEPVILNFAVRNGLQQTFKLDLGINRKGNFLFTVTRPDGSRVQLRKSWKMGFSRHGMMSLEPNQTYEQNLLLNEWFDFPEIGRYEIEARLRRPGQTQEGNSVGEAAAFHTSLEIKPRDVEQLKSRCATLVQRIVDATSYHEAAEAALVLSYVKDPVAVPYLEKALASGEVSPIAVDGLVRIGDKSAVKALLSAETTQSQQVVEELIRPGLARIGAEPLSEVQEESHQP